MTREEKETYQRLRHEDPAAGTAFLKSLLDAAASAAGAASATTASAPPPSEAAHVG